jgi:hypothetical protein
MIITRSVLLRMGNISDKTCREKTHILRSVTFSKNRAVYEIMFEIFDRARQAEKMLFACRITKERIQTHTHI